MTATFKPLPWDSDLFGFPVARLMPGLRTPEQFSAALAALEEGGFRLVYATVPWSDREAREGAEHLGARMVDRKTLYEREVLPAAENLPPGIHVHHGAGAPEMETLALSSGQFSRFRVDPDMPSGVFETLYHTWLRRSLQAEIADGVLVVLRQGRTAGLVTVAMQGGTGVIGLIAVAHDAQRQGIGKRLIRGAEAWVVQAGGGSMRVTTQGANVPACALYEACGYAIMEVQAFYHFWLPLRVPR